MSKNDTTKFSPITGVERHILHVDGDGMLGAGDASAHFDMPSTPQEGFAEGWNRRAEIALLLAEESQKQVTYSHESEFDDGRKIAFAQGSTHSGWLVLSNTDVNENDEDVESLKTLRLYKYLGDAIVGNWEVKLWDLPAGTDAKKFIKSPAVEGWFTTGVDDNKDAPASRWIAVVLRATNQGEGQFTITPAASDKEAHSKSEVTWKNGIKGEVETVIFFLIEGATNEKIEELTIPVATWDLLQRADYEQALYDMALTGQSSLSSAVEYLAASATDNEAEAIKKSAEIDAQTDAAEAHAEERMINQPEEEYMAEEVARQGMTS
jgi:hypothetical protein